MKIQLFLALLLGFFGVLGSAQAGDWAHYGGDAGGSKYSPLAQNTPKNVRSLEQAWTFSTRDVEERTSDEMRSSALEVTPILADGRLYMCSAFNEVIALHPGTGEQIWRFDPEVATDRRPGNQYTCRGVTYWVDPDAEPTARCASRIFTGTVDSRVISLDARTGEPCTGFGAEGIVAIKPEIDLWWPGEFQITSAPVIAAGKLIIGSAISDNARAEAPRGTVRAYDVRTGELEWTFDPVPRDASSPVADSWSEDGRAITGPANVWALTSLDEDRGWVFLSTSSTSTDQFSRTRPRANSYSY